MSAPTDTPSLAAESALDGAYARFGETAAEYRGGLTNHGPMAAEALVMLGADAARVEAWAEAYTGCLEPATARTVSPGDASEDPLIGLRAAWPELVQGWAAAAFHAPIRVAHAVRALGRSDCPARRRELALGIAYWREAHRPIVGAEAVRVWRGDARPFEDSMVSVLRAFDHVPRTSAATRERAQGLIRRRLATTEALEGFPEALAPIEVDLAHHELLLSALAAFCVRASLQVPRARFTYLHGLTGTVALRRLGDVLGVEALGQALPHHIAALAAVHATHHEGPTGLAGSPMQVELPPGSPPSPGALRQHALRDDDEHTIKFVEAALAEFALAEDPALLWAVMAWCEHGFG